MNEKVQRLVLEDATIIFKNFSGLKGPYNRNGERTFSVLIPSQEEAEVLMNLGWNVKQLKGSDENPPAYHIPVKLGYEGRVPPRVYAVRTNGKLQLHEDTVAMLDHQPIKQADVVLNPYFWSVDGDTGVKAYLHMMYATIDESELDLRYADLPDL